MRLRNLAGVFALLIVATVAYAQNGITSVTNFGAKGNGTTDDTAAFVAALSSGAGYLMVPNGKYLISSPLVIPSNIIIQFAGGATLIAGADNLQFFQVTTSAYYSQIRDASLDGNGHSGVYGFNLSNFREKARIDNANMSNMQYGIVLQQLCWDLVIDNPYSSNVVYPLLITNGSNAVDVRHPALNAYTTGIQIVTGPTYPTIGVSITGGYVQSGTDGLIDGGIGTRIQNTDFESNTDVDIYLLAATNPEVRGTLHFGGIGIAAIRGRQTTGARIDNPLMGSGNRSLGLYDFDNSNTDSFEWHASTAGYMNLPLGNVTGLGTFVTNP